MNRELSLGGRIWLCALVLNWFSGKELVKDMFRVVLC